MAGTHSSDFAITRRTVLGGLAAFGIQPGHAKPSCDLHRVAAARAVELSGGKPLKLNLLVPEGTGHSIDIITDAFFDATGIRVRKIESSVANINSDLTLAHLSQSHQYDLALLATFAVSDLAQSGAIIPITQYAKTYEPAGFRDGVLYNAGGQIGDELYGFQSDGDAYLMFYNNMMLEDPAAQYDYSLKYGTTLAWPRTWGELDRQMKFFHRPEKDQYGGLLFRSVGYVAWEWWVRFHAKGLWPFTSEMEPLIASEPGVRALEDMIAVSEHLHPDVRHLDLFGNWKAYAQGNTYANIGWGGSQKYFQGPNSRIKDKTRAGPTPGGVINGKLLVTPYFNWGWTYSVCSASAVPEIAYLFSLFASSPEISTQSVRQTDGFFDPFRPEHYQDRGIQLAYSPEFLKVHRKSLDRSIPDLYLPHQSEYFQTLGEWLYRALSREISPKDALENVAMRWDAITRTVGRARQKKNWANLKLAYPETVRSQLREII